MQAYLNPVKFTSRLIILWGLLSWHFTTFLVSLGLLSVALVIWISYRMKIFTKGDRQICCLLESSRYFIWLLGQMIRTSCNICLIILKPSLPIRPTGRTLKTMQQSTVGQVIYANSITLTPGTITVTVKQKELYVHALTETDADTLTYGDMDQRVKECIK